MQDPLLGQDLSARWADAGLLNRIDVAGQSAELWRADDESINEENIQLAAGIARAYGVEIRDRIGINFQPDNDLDELQKRIAGEYRQCFAQAIMFGLPALVVHYLAPILSGGPTDDGSYKMIYPWLIEMVLVGWLLRVSAWSILWQAAMSLIHVRATGDLFTGFVIIATFVASAIGVIMSPFIDNSFVALDGTLFHVAVVTTIIVTAQRCAAHGLARQLGGHSQMMLRNYGRLIRIWLIACLLAWLLKDYRWALGFALLLPPMMSFGAIAPRGGASAILPIFGFAVFLLIAEKPALKFDVDVNAVVIEIAFAFSVMMTLVFIAGWKRIKAIDE